MKAVLSTRELNEAVFEYLLKHGYPMPKTQKIEVTLITEQLDDNEIEATVELTPVDEDARSDAA